MRSGDWVNGATLPRLGQAAYPVRYVTADWDPSCWKITRHDGTQAVLTKEEFLRNEWYVPGTTALIVESAHMRERNEKSVSQVYTTDQLNGWNPPCDVLLFPEKIAKKVGAFAGKGKSRDSENLYLYAEAHPKTVRCLKKWVRPSARDDSSWAWRNAIREDAAKMLNKMRAEWAKPGRPYDVRQVQHAQALVETFYDDLTDQQRAQFGLRRGKVGEFKGRVRFEGAPTQLMTLYACVFDDSGDLRLNDNGEFYGVRACTDQVVGLTHSYMKNLSRANIMWFAVGAKVSAIKKRAKKAEEPVDEEALRQLRREVVRNIKVMVRHLRDSATV